MTESQPIVIHPTEEEAFRRKQEARYDSLLARLNKKLESALRDFRKEGEKNGPSIEDEFNGGKKSANK